MDSRATSCAGFAQENALEVLASCVVDTWALSVPDAGTRVLMPAMDSFDLAIAVVALAALAVENPAVVVVLVIVLTVLAVTVAVVTFVAVSLIVLLPGVVIAIVVPVVTTEFVEADGVVVSHPLHVLSH